jgi:hypothetical protein
MQYERHDPAMEQGIIAGSGFLDWQRVQQLQRDAEDPSYGGFRYLGGARAEHHNVMPGLISMGLKGVRNYEVMYGEADELGTVSVAGAMVEEENERAFLDQFYFQGIVATEDRSENPMDRNASDPNSGYTFVRAGAVSVEYIGRKTVYPGDYLMVATPPMDRNDTKNAAKNWELAPFDYTDFKLELRGSFHSMQMDKNRGGIQDMGFHEFFRTYGLPSVPAYSCEQEEAAGLKYGYVGAVLRGIEFLARQGYVAITQPAGVAARAQAVQGNDMSADTASLAERIGLWGPDGGAWLPMLVAIFQGDLDDTLKDQRDAAMGLNVNSAALDRYNVLRAHISKFTLAHVAGAWFHKTSRIVGRARNACNPGETMHILLGHFVF